MATRIEDYTAIGNCETMALVERDGAIDCLRFRREMPSLPTAVPVSPFCQSLSVNIFLFTEIRIWRTNRPSRFSKRGDRPSSVREPGMWWTRQRRVREVRAGRIAFREPEASCGRTALKVRLVGNPWSCHHGRGCRRRGRMRVRQNRVVLAVVATVKLLRR